MEARPGPRSALTPLRTRWEGGEPVLQCCDLGGLAFTDPFFRDTCLRLRRREPKPQLVEVGLAALREETAGEPSLPPAGFIFHMSRCGSTLVSRLLSTSDRLLVLSEPDPLSGLLAPPAAVEKEMEEETLVRRLRDLVHLLGRPRRASEQRLVIKLSSLLVTRLPLIRKAFPETPWLFVFREPGEVMVSVLDEPAGFLRMKSRPETAARWMAMTPEAVAEMADEDYVARCLGHMMGCALDGAEHAGPGRCRMLDYRNLPQAVWTSVADLFGIAWTPEEEARLREQSSVYSKDGKGRRRFEPDSAAKADRVTARMRAAAARWAAAPYERLRALAP